MNVARKDGKLLLTFAWALTMTRPEFAHFSRRGTETGLLATTDDAVAEFTAAETFFAMTGIHRHAVVTDLFEIAADDRVLPSRVIVGWHERYEALTVLAAVRVPGSAVSHEEVDLGIAVLQSFQGRPSGAGPGHAHGRFRGTAYPSARDALAAAMAELDHLPGRDIELQRCGWCVELRGYHGGAATSSTRGIERQLYGLAEGDEGWRFVSQDWAAARLGPHWGSRELFAAYATDNGAVCVNNKGSEYVEHQRRFTQRHRGAEEPFFTLDSDVAGLDHGILLFVERVLMQLARAEAWLRQARSVLPRGPGGVLATSGQSLRRSLNDVVRLLDLLVPPELGSLERRLEASMGLERLVTRLDRQAEAIDEESRHLYQVRMNVLIAILTCVTIVLAVAQVVVPFFAGK
ncbi:MAG TPA: hypothetical protein VHC18_08885 [Amycolatopsis sp.]|nr:hypothetical protein [Amycolatopsis sp.]